MIISFENTNFQPEFMSLTTSGSKILVVTSSMYLLWLTLACCCWVLVTQSREYVKENMSTAEMSTPFRNVWWESLSLLNTLDKHYMNHCSL